ncbi:Mitochondrial pyruvate dehydrogenase kinase [Pseudohyphozyma bogoriensis]|nr:Mitochondrial pyruvate dehydrogenase kinase [Pseudohyphozyma bogoriensis]
MSARALFVLFGLLSSSTWLVRAQSCANGGTPTFQNGAYYCCTTIANTPIDSTDPSTGADSCAETTDTSGNSIYQCSYTTNTGLTARTYQFPTTVASLTLEIAGDNGRVSDTAYSLMQRNDMSPGLTQIVTGTVSDLASFTDGLAYIFVGAGGGEGSVIDGAGGGFSSFGFNSAYATTDAAVQGPEDGRIAVAGGGGGGALNGVGGDAGYPDGASGGAVPGYTLPSGETTDGDYGGGGTQTQGGVGHSGDSTQAVAVDGVGAIGGTAIPEFYSLTASFQPSGTALGVRYSRHDIDHCSRLGLIRKASPVPPLSARVLCLPGTLRLLFFGVHSPGKHLSLASSVTAARFSVEKEPGYLAL